MEGSGIERIRSDSLYYGSAFKLASLLSKVRFSNATSVALRMLVNCFFPQGRLKCCLLNSNLYLECPHCSAAAAELYVVHVRLVHVVNIYYFLFALAFFSGDVPWFCSFLGTFLSDRR